MLELLSKEELIDLIKKKDEETQSLNKWVSDLQAGIYVNCVYCGHRYGKSGEVPDSMADILKQHIEECPKHPMSQLKNELAEKNREIVEWEASFDLYHKAGMRAIKMYKAAHPDFPDLSWPDAAVNMVWLIEQLEKATKLLKDCNREIWKYEKGSHGLKVNIQDFLDGLKPKK